MLQCVHQFVGEHQAQRAGLPTLHREQRGGIGVVETGDLFGVQGEKEPTQVDRVRHHVQQPVRRGDSLEPRVGELARQLGDQVGADLVLGAHGGLGHRLELETGGLGDAGHQRVDQNFQLLLVDGLGGRRRAAAGDERDEDQCDATICVHANLVGPRG